MEEQSSTDHLSSSLTDLMTSLMVIFILLLLVFVSRRAGEVEMVKESLLKQLQQELQPYGFTEDSMRRDPRDRNAILVIVPNRLMNFDSGKSTLSQDGQSFLQSYIPSFAGVLCGERFRSSIESIVVEGHTDSNKYKGATPEESQNLNLKLSQDRSMEVVKSTLANLNDRKDHQACFLEKLSASGRGEQELEATADESRRVILKIRVKSVDIQSLKEAVK
jgi:outer membrane protein OmpA-like peptidoglycan-associated protein